MKEEGNKNLVNLLTSALGANAQSMGKDNATGKM